jgi:hypothetical protein
MAPLRRFASVYGALNIPIFPHDFILIMRQRKRVGRGTGSGLGKLAGFGHQFSRSTPRAFEGGQTPMYKRFPKIGFYNPR